MSPEFGEIRIYYSGFQGKNIIKRDKYKVSDAFLQGYLII